MLTQTVACRPDRFLLFAPDFFGHSSATESACRRLLSTGWRAMQARRNSKLRTPWPVNPGCDRRGGVLIVDDDVDMRAMLDELRMKTVCICGSFRYHDEMIALRETRLAILLYPERLNRADRILVHNKGYLGNSVVESDYAYVRWRAILA